VTEMTGAARVVMLDRRWPGDIAERGGDLLDVAFGWADFAKLRRLVSRQCADAGLTRPRLDDFVLAVHEIAANAIVHAGAGGRLILRRAANGLRCVVADTTAESMGPDSTIVSLYMRLDREGVNLELTTDRSST